jgi:hypothetical protein
VIDKGFKVRKRSPCQSSRVVECDCSTGTREAIGAAAYKALSNIDGDGGKSMSDQNRHSFTLAITPPPADGGDVSAASAHGSIAGGMPEGVRELLHLTLSVEVPGQDIIRVSAVDGRGRRYEGRLSLSLTSRTDACYVCDANGCRWVTPC